MPANGKWELTWSLKS